MTDGLAAAEQSSWERLLIRHRQLVRERLAAEACRTFGWGGTVLAGDGGVTVPLVRGWAQAGDLELDREQARELGQALLDAASNNDTDPLNDQETLMSYDVWLTIDTGGTEPAYVGRDLNYTSNVRPMWSKALEGSAIQSVADMDGRIAADCLAPLEHAVAAMLADPAVFEAMSPANGWGTADGARTFLKELAETCRENPKATVRVSR